ncbi:MAG: deoxyribonuclease V [Chromatiaceae bacterium]|nr:deoxyribonuclease V [Chromatiaceae bacterium]
MFGDLEWPTTTCEARAVQERLHDQVVRRDELTQVRRVAGLDVGFPGGGDETRAGVAILSFPDLLLLESASARRRTVFPYVPGLLSFREAPALLEALASLSEPPQLLLCDGQGYAHPRRCGLACHLGVLTGIPSIGVAKSRLIGEHGPLGPEKGDWTPLWDHDEIIGALVRTRRNVQPLYISVGHKISLETAVRFVLACTTRFRLPETTRWAHRLASLE